MITSIPPNVARHLGYYVYLYVDPRDERVFYVGKGQGERILSHLDLRGESRKAQVLQEIEAAGLEPRLEVLAHALADEETAFRIEAAVIDLFGLDDLTNLCRGWRSIQLGRLPLAELMTYYAAVPVEVEDPALLIRVNRLYRHNMSASDLYEATRGVWRLSKRREGARYALAVFEGVVREVYVIDAWQPAGTTPYASRPPEDVEVTGRWEFTGRLAPDAVREKYRGRSVAAYFKRGQQFPVVYVAC